MESRSGNQLNTGSYTFASPAPQFRLNTTIARIDWIPTSAKQPRLRRVAICRKTRSLGVEQFPAFTSYGVNFAACAALQSRR